MHKNRNILLIYPVSSWGNSKNYRFTTGMSLPLLYLSGAVRAIYDDITIFDQEDSNGIG
jgi:hypothetical protein